MTSYRPIDSKREEFRKYLEKAGAMDALTKVLVMLYDEPEKPADALDYIRKHLGDNRPDEAEMEVLKADLEAATLKAQSLEDEIQILKQKLLQYEPEEKQSGEVDLAEGERTAATRTATAGGGTPVPSPVASDAAAAETRDEPAPAETPDAAQ